jgi:hypothetical protein
MNSGIPKEQHVTAEQLYRQMKPTFRFGDIPVPEVETSKSLFQRAKDSVRYVLGFEQNPPSGVSLRVAHTFDAAKEAAEAFVGKPIENANTGMIATASRINIRKMLSNSAVKKSETAQAHSLAVANLDILFNRATYGWGKPDKHNDPNVASIHRLFSAMRTDDGAYLVKLTVKEFASKVDGNRIYSVEAVDVNEKSPAVKWVAAYAKSDGVDLTSTRPSGDVLSLAQAVQDGNYRFFQNQETPRGSFDPATLTITFSKNKNLSTFLHEIGHFFLKVNFDLAAQIQTEAKGQALPVGRQRMVDDAKVVLDWFGVKDVDTWNAMTVLEQRPYHEKFARAFEKYLYEGKAPSHDLLGMFQRFRDWLIAAYKDSKELEGVDLSPEVREVFDRMVANEEQIAQMRTLQRLEPIFRAAEEAGKTPEEWAAYQEENRQAIADAIDEHGSRMLRDTRYLHNLRNREARRLRGNAAFLRREARMEARTEIMSEPVYRAWDFLTGKIEDTLPAERYSTSVTLDPSSDSLFVAIAKLGGMNREQVGAEWGIKDSVKGNVFGRPVLRAKGGKTIDDMAQALAERGYLRKDEHGKVDVRELEEAFADELSGRQWHTVTLEYTSSYLTVFHSRSTKTLSRQQPLPSMLILMPWCVRTPIKAALVNRFP